MLSKPDDVIYIWTVTVFLLAGGPKKSATQSPAYLVGNARSFSFPSTYQDLLSKCRIQRN